MKKCKDCKHNGKCEFQDSIPDSFIKTRKELENSEACEYFKTKMKMTKIYEVVENDGNEVILISDKPIRVRISHTEGD